MSRTTTIAQIVSISTALVASGGIATLSLFDVPELQAQPASRSLPSIRWLFSRGSHIFPTASVLSSASFAYLAYAALPATGSRTVLELLRYGKVPGYIAAAILTFSIAPFTSTMIPTNFTLIQRNEELGGARSQSAAKAGSARPGAKNAEQSVNNEDQPSQYTDLSVPQEKTVKDSSTAQDEEVRELLNKFGQLNFVRAGLMLAGGVVGLYTAIV